MAGLGDRAFLADLIDARREEIVRRWVDRVGRDLEVTHFEATDLRDGIAEYLHRLSEELRTTRSIEQGGTSAWEDVARQHALTRVRLGFNVEQLVRELILLRRTVLDAVRSLDASGTVHHAELITELTDAAIVASVRHYVEARDYDLRRRQAEHLGFLAHRVRSPLAAAVLTVERLKTKPLGDGAQEPLERLLRTLDRVHELIDQVLEVERLEAGAAENRPVQTTLGAVLGDVVSGAGQDAARKGLAFRADFEADLRLEVDPKLFVSAVEQLLENAVKYTDAGEVTLEVEERPSEIAVHVRDSCGGLSQEELEIVFEPFRRGRTDKAGTGLGLAIARRAAETLGGEIHAKSPPGAPGCHFWLIVPRARH